MRFTVDDEHGRPVSFECDDTLASRWTSGAILEGRTYPEVPFLEPVRTVVDIGANCGATTVLLARRHPGARVHAVEPGSRALSLLRRNVADLPDVAVHPVALHDADGTGTLVVPDHDVGQASIAGRDGDGEEVVVRSAAAWATEQGIDAIDVLKVDVEGAEVAVLQSLAPLLPTVQLLYVEYDSRSDRRAIDRLLEPTHELYIGAVLTLDQGECTYLRADLADRPEAHEHLRAWFQRSAAGG